MIIQNKAFQTGTPSDPRIRGSLKTERARLESAVTGTVVDNVQASGRFGGSRFVLDSFSGTTKKGGKVSGRGTFDLSAAKGFGMDVRVDAVAAQLIDRAAGLVGDALAVEVPLALAHLHRAGDAREDILRHRFARPQGDEQRDRKAGTADPHQHVACVVRHRHHCPHVGEVGGDIG